MADCHYVTVIVALSYATARPCHRWRLSVRLSVRPSHAGIDMAPKMQDWKMRDQIVNDGTIESYA